PRINFAAGQLAAFTRLGPLRHLDLQFFGLGKVETGHAETAGSNLFNRAIAGVAVRIGHVAGRVFSAFTGVALAAYSIHGDSQGFVRFLADRAVGHRARFEALENALG